MQLLKELAPDVTRVGVCLREPANPAGIGQWAVIQAAAETMGVELTPLAVRDVTEIERGIAAFERGGNGGLIVAVSSAVNLHQQAIIANAARHRSPTIYPYRYMVAAGGLISYGPKKAIKSMNQLGIVIDLSHSGDRTAMEALEFSEQPVIFSHSTSRALFNRPRSAPDPLIVAAAKKGGVICQDVRANTSVAEYADWIDYCVKLAGIDHVGVSAQDDWHRSYKDTKRIAPYLPSFAAEFAKRDWSEDRIYRRDGIGARLLDRENLAAELKGRNYSAEEIDKILGGNMMRVLTRVLR